MIISQVKKKGDSQENPVKKIVKKIQPEISEFQAGFF
jgi:hypothetical protein